MFVVTRRSKTVKHYGEGDKMAPHVTTIFKGSSFYIVLCTYTGNK